MKKPILTSASKWALLSLLLTHSFHSSFAQTLISYWDFNSSPNGTALQSVPNTGTIPAPWTTFNTSEAKADGAGNFTISGGTGNWTRKAALATPLTSGKYRAELNLSGWNINSGVTGVNNLAFKVLDATAGNTMANLIFDIQSNTNVRVRYSTYATSDNGINTAGFLRDGASYSLLQTEPVRLAIEFDFDNNTVDYLLNGTSFYTSASTTTQFWGTQAHTLSLVKAGTWGSNSTLSIDSFGLTQVPEPSSLLLVWSGLATLCIFQRRKRQNQ